MPTFILTGNYTAKALQGMIASPSDREATVRPLFEAMGGKILSFYLTTGENDFMIIAEMPDGADMIAGLIATGASGTVSNMKTVRAFSSAEFVASQKKAGDLVKLFKPAG